ncbi:unnamed protein product, partial [Ostreobium quekettii]
MAQIGMPLRAAAPVALRWMVVFFSLRAALGDTSFRILHFNDVHSRVEPSSKYQGPCKESQRAEGLCFGGFAKLATVVKRERAKGSVIVLDAGDEFM